MFEPVSPGGSPRARYPLITRHSPGWLQPSRSHCRPSGDGRLRKVTGSVIWRHLRESRAVRATAGSARAGPIPPCITSPVRPVRATLGNGHAAKRSECASLRHGSQRRQLLQSATSTSSGRRMGSRGDRPPLARVFGDAPPVSQAVDSAEARVPEIGAGPCRFTIELARMGCRVVVSDVSGIQLQLKKRYVGVDVRSQLAQTQRSRDSIHQGLPHTPPPQGGAPARRASNSLTRALSHPCSQSPKRRPKTRQTVGGVVSRWRTTVRWPSRHVAPDPGSASSAQGKAHR